MIAARRPPGWILPWILCAAAAWAVPATEPDPHDIYQAASEHLRSGNLKAAQAGASKLRDLLTRHPEWDPGGVFARELLPPMEAHLQRLRLTERELERFTHRALGDTKPPPIAEDQNAARFYGDWATSTIDRLRRERDGLIAVGLPAPEDQAILVLTESYATSEKLLETEILRLVNEAVTREIKIMMPEGQQLQTVHVRLDQIKKDMMESVIERDRLHRELDGFQAKSRTYQEALIGLVLDPPPSRAEAAAGDLGSVFSTHLDREVEKLRSEPSQSRAEYLARRESLDRYRRFNRVLSRAGLLQDQSVRIGTLAKTVENTPVADRGWSLASAPRWFRGLLIGFLAVTLVAFGWVAADRLRQRGASPSVQPSASARAAGFPRGEDGTNAA